ncbi:hypothetical protein AY599_00780 [Leptolyngbya valderiana BDU 20041]|nr:hypothetical protein AY599_00780 [Leptolyngbya valderiana BDU 20041]
MATTGQVQLVPPVDGLDLLVDGNEFLLVRVQDQAGERIRIGVRDSTVRLLLAVRPRVNRARFFVVLAGVLLTIALAFLIPVGIGLPPLLGFAMAVAVGLVGLVVVLMAQPTREYRFHDDLPGGLDRPPLMVLSERSGQQSWYALRDERGWMFGDVSRRLGKWRVRGFEAIEPPPPSDDEQAAAEAAKASNLASALYAWSVAMAEDEPAPEGSAPELSVTIVRDYLNLASVVGGLVSGPIGLALAFSGPWKRMEFKRGGRVVATGHKLDDGNAMHLEIADAFDAGVETEAWIDRRHVLALAVLSLSFEAER